MEDYKRQSYEDIYEKMKALVFGKPIKATDANDGSVLCSLLEAVSRVIAEGYLYCTTGYDKHLSKLPESAFGMKRITGWKARGKVRFYTELLEDNTRRPAESDIWIGKNTELSDGNVEFITLKGGYIKKGEGESELIDIEAKEIGEKGNVPSGAITKIISSVSNRIREVKNVTECSDGRSKETNEAFRKRFIHYLRGLQRTNKDGIITASLQVGAYHVNVETVSPAEVIRGHGYSNYYANCKVYVCDKNGKASPTLLSDVRKKLEGDGSKENSGYTPAGVNIAVLPVKTNHYFRELPKRLFIQVRTSLNDKSKAEEVIKDAVFDFFQDFRVGQGLVVTDLIVVVRTLHWVHDVKIKQGGVDGNELSPIKMEAGELLVVEKEDILVDFSLV